MVDKKYLVSFQGTELPYSTEVYAKNKRQAISKVYNSFHKLSRKYLTDFKAVKVKQHKRRV